VFDTVTLKPSMKADDLAVVELGPLGDIAQQS